MSNKVCMFAVVIDPGNGKDPSWVHSIHPTPKRAIDRATEVVKGWGWGAVGGPIRTTIVNDLSKKPYYASIISRKHEGVVVTAAYIFRVEVDTDDLLTAMANGETV